MNIPTPIRHLRWVGDAAGGHLELLDQRQLPARECWLACRDVPSLWHAIKELAVRGAPAIGIAAAYGCVIAAQKNDLVRGADDLATSRPTAVNLFWAIDRMKRVTPATPQALLEQAKKIHDEDAAMCQAIGEHSLKLIEPLLNKREQEGGGTGGILTHCNAGALATGGIGTATAVMYLLHGKGKTFRVYADETRPLWQGARLTAYELSRSGIDVTIQCDSMAASLMAQGKVQAVIVGADRIAANGDAANKVGTYPLAIVAKHHGVPFFVAAPSSTFDLSLASGAGIPIEYRADQEIVSPMGLAVGAPQAHVFNPAFDVTPASLITAIITERGAIQPVTSANVAQTLLCPSMA